MIDKTVSRRITLEGYNYEVMPDQIVFFAPTAANGNTTWNGMCTPGVVAFYPWEDGPALVVSCRSVYFNGALQLDGLTVNFNFASMRIVDPVTTYNGVFSGWLLFVPGSGGLTVDWGDGSSADSFELSPAGADPIPQHVYAEAGTYTVTASAGFTDSNYTIFGTPPSVTTDLVVAAP